MARLNISKAPGTGHLDRIDRNAMVDPMEMKHVSNYTSIRLLSNKAVENGVEKHETLSSNSSDVLSEEVKTSAVLSEQDICSW